jgi:hypothetical protein
MSSSRRPAKCAWASTCRAFPRADRGAEGPPGDKPCFVSNHTFGPTALNNTAFARGSDAKARGAARRRQRGNSCKRPSQPRE